MKVTESCPTPCDPMDYIVHGILQARLLEWLAFRFSRGSSQPTQGSNTWMNLKGRHRLLDSEGEGEGGIIWENGILTCILSCKN